MTNPTETAQWAELTSASTNVPSIRSLLEAPRSELRVTGPGLVADFSRQRLTVSTRDLLLELVASTHVCHQRDAMFAGEAINSTENRSVLHTALRRPVADPLVVNGTNVSADVHQVLGRLSSFSTSIRNGEWTGVTGKSINRVINIGIGGSDLGPAMAYTALKNYADPNISFAFVSNVDPEDMVSALATSDPERTLFIIVSKTFTTTETMMNARLARQWALDSLNVQDPREVVERHFVAVSTNAAEVDAFGIASQNVFGFWDWVGGRYSMESAVGLSTMIAIGPEAFHELLAGSFAMDQHFLTEPPATNIPILMGAMSVWNRDFLGISTTAVLPYAQVLARFPAYLQQLTMESNGKRVRKDGSLVNYNTGAIYWGEPGTNGQHSFYQLLHQGTEIVACDIIVVSRGHTNQTEQHETLVANALAQASVLSVGVTREELAKSSTPVELISHKEMPGDRPVTVLMLETLNPFSLGALIALYEHSVFVQGAIWGINSFDQWGVELGKKVAVGIQSAFEDRNLTADFDSSTRESIKEYLQQRDGD
ncbi:MAG: glucose-6-phosphate isomerase [Candidatus Nanopelagicales bacterium]|nr:glucose-6-phosphate isomerase [Candidatus Nanopelagicales bacterium]MCF8538933.1 glucose-6-phosphate isomerase [Candidatus Nanopelagicales bacterium]MCF8550685.1 glucose-6-phosphate isomerase [Candidatus Nanopelagicales bacterium]